MTYAEYIRKMEMLIESLSVAQNFAAHEGLSAQAMSINAARVAISRDAEGAHEYAIKNDAYNQEVV